MQNQYLTRKLVDIMKVPKARKLPSGSWFVRVAVNGKRISVTMPTKKQAEAEAMRIKLGDKAAPSGSMSLRDAVDRYIDNRRNTLSPSTIRGYVTIRDNRLQDLVAMDVNAITQDDCQRAVDKARRNYSAKTVTNSWRFLSTVIEYATDKKIKVSLPQVVHKERSWLTPEQIEVFVPAIRGTKVEIPALFALCSLRCSEILDIKWSDVDLDRKIVHVTGSAVPDEDGNLVHKEENKNSSSRRIVPLIPPLVSALSSVEFRGDYVVTMTANGIYKSVNRICKENGLPEVGIHGLRHSFASLAYHLGLDEKTTMQIGGWSDDRTMHQIYTHIAQQDINSAAEKLMSFYDPEKKVEESECHPA